MSGERKERRPRGSLPKGDPAGHGVVVEPAGPSWGRDFPDREWYPTWRSASAHCRPCGSGIAGNIDSVVAFIIEHDADPDVYGDLGTDDPPDYWKQRFWTPRA